MSIISETPDSRGVDTSRRKEPILQSVGFRRRAEQRGLPEPSGSFFQQCIFLREALKAAGR